MLVEWLEKEAGSTMVKTAASQFLEEADKISIAGGEKRAAVLAPTVRKMRGVAGKVSDAVAIPTATALGLAAKKLSDRRIRREALHRAARR